MSYLVRGIRRAIVRRFPYGVFYLVADTEIRVIAVVDMARNPSVWQGRAWFGAYVSPHSYWLKFEDNLVHQKSSLTF